MRTRADQKEMVGIWGCDTGVPTTGHMVPQQERGGDGKMPPDRCGVYTWPTVVTTGTGDAQFCATLGNNNIIFNL